MRGSGRTGLQGALAAALFLVSPGVLAQEPAPQAPVQAYWKESELAFTYMGRTTFYSCDALEDKVSRILRELGAREDLEVRATGCWNWTVPERFVTVRIRLALPVLADPGEGLSPEERSRRELVARVRGDEAPDLELLEPFPATRERVTLSRRLRFLEDGDCELVEQLDLQVFRKLDIGGTGSTFWCIPGRIRHGQLDYEADVLKALPSPDEPARQ